MNLFGNALKYTSNGYVCVSLTSSMVPSALNPDARPLAILSVSDTGKGISREFLKHHIYKPFWQEDSLATGTGLGLSIVQQIVRDLAGHIEIRSKEGVGTKVTVRIPFDLPTLSPPVATDSIPHANENDDDGTMHSNVRRKMRGLKVHIIASSATSSPSSLLSTNGTNSTSEPPPPQTNRAVGFSSIREALRKTLKSWFEMDIVEASSIDSAAADIYLLLTDDLSTTEEDEKHNHTESTGILRNPKLLHLAKTNALIVLSTTAPASLHHVSKSAVHVIQQP